MAKKAKRIIIDTNLWISFLITNNLKNIDADLKQGKLKIIFSIELIEEFISVAKRPKFKQYFSSSDIDRLLNLFEIFGEIVPVETDVKLCRDEKDNFLLALAIDSKADYLITGDQDILELKKIGDTEIISLSDFLLN